MTVFTEFVRFCVGFRARLCGEGPTRASISNTEANDLDGPSSTSDSGRKREARAHRWVVEERAAEGG